LLHARTLRDCFVFSHPIRLVHAVFLGTTLSKFFLVLDG
jgi:hypothetical protein